MPATGDISMRTDPATVGTFGPNGERVVPANVDRRYPKEDVDHRYTEEEQ